MGYGFNMKIRTKNKAELAVLARLQGEGWIVVKRGWPDFLVVRGNEVRLIEVKRTAGYGLSRPQREVARILALLGLKVELMTPGG